MDIEDWDVSIDELDELEKRAFMQIEARKRSNHEASVSTEKYEKATDYQVLLWEEDNRLCARAQYTEAFKLCCQSIPGRQWNPNQKMWTFPINVLRTLVEQLQNLSGLKVKLDIRPPLTLDHLMPPNLKKTCYESSILQRENFDMKSTVSPEETHFFQEKQPLVNIKRPSLKVTFSLHECGQVEAFFPFTQEVVNCISKLKGAAWIPSQRAWMFPFSSYQEALRGLKSMDGVKVEELDPLVIRALEVLSQQNDDSSYYEKLPKDLEGKLLPFQKDGIKFALKRGGRALIADEMGLGKTLQALCVAVCYREEWPVLVITPPSLRVSWAMAIQQWLEGIVDPQEITVALPSASRLREGFNSVKASGKSSVSVSGTFYVTSYDMVNRLPSSAKFKVVIADEGHYLKNPKAKRTSSTLPFLQKAQRCIILTGTPALSRPIELFKQLQALYPKVYKNVREYGNRYCMPEGVQKMSQFGEFRGCSHVRELHSLVKATVMVRRKKAEVMPQLPPKFRQQVILEPEPGAMAQVKALFHQLEELKNVRRVQPEESLKALDQEKNLLINKIYMASAAAKSKCVQDYLSTILEDGCKFLVFAHHQVMLDAVEEKIKGSTGYIRIDGQTPAAIRPALVSRFQEDENIRVAVLSLNAAGVGLTLTAASTVVFAEMGWTPGVLVQAEDRAHRIGQVDSVNVVYLHARETVDDMIWETVVRKLENLGQVMDGQNEVLDVTKEEQSLLSKGQLTLYQCNAIAKPPDTKSS